MRSNMTLPEEENAVHTSPPGRRQVLLSVFLMHHPAFFALLFRESARDLGFVWCFHQLLPQSTKTLCSPSPALHRHIDDST